ncbi:bromodomain-containing protein [Rhizophagus clarus]|uniref:Bromodomain-containing protein n=1 Tax=Rhizophagus clarus TaxID=94130 RepID=A0A8H3KWN3_9GLOM|nr:bromodomain-containing protein [Rhizophagus clarus]
MDTTTKNYIGYEALNSYLHGSKNWSYLGFLDLNRNTVIASLTSLTDAPLTLVKWQSYHITWYNRFLIEAKEILEPNTFIELKKKLNTDHLRYPKKLQIFWEGIIKECEKENLVSTTTTLPEKTHIKDLSETLQPGSKKNTLLEKPLYIKDFSKTIQSDLNLQSDSKKNIKLIDFYYNILHELENISFSHSFFKHIEKDIINKHDRQTRELKRVRDNNYDADTNSLFKKQIQILKQNEDKLVYRQVINDGLLVASAYENLVAGEVIPFIEVLKTFLLTRSQMSLFSADEPNC